MGQQIAKNQYNFYHSNPIGFETTMEEKKDFSVFNSELKMGTNSMKN